MTKTLAAWLQRLERLHPRQVDLGLQRVGAVARKLAQLPVRVPVVTVGGTNGKGSTVAVLEALLAEAGMTVGAFTSPHLLRFNERIRVAGRDASDAEIIEAFEAIEVARGAVSLTYFEFSALAALYVFRQRGVDCLLLEVGLGGRLDAVNIVDPSVAVITSIDLDHQDWLGASRDAIAREKAGILRQGVPVIVADPDPPPVLRDCVVEQGAHPALFLGRHIAVHCNARDWDLQVVDTGGGVRHIDGLPHGAVLPENICAAVQAALLLGVQLPAERLRSVVQAVAPPARRQTLMVQGRRCLLDVAHNPAAVARLAEYLARGAGPGRTLAVFCAMGDKDLAGMIAAARDTFDAWFLADLPGNERAAPAERIAGLLRAAGQGPVRQSSAPGLAFALACGEAGPADRIVAFGSFFTIAAILPELERLVDTGSTGCE